MTCELAHQLDGVQLKAFLAAIAALSAGLGDVASIAAGNIVLASAGHPPVPTYASETE
ncbi:hypothetical protein [Pseudoflavonifractor sp. 524-17]|uniref:hypothetical protein n=1 Tax=Pseudoflavonifractor sp. 524-17 TaxID=2304577 RepID=UPI00137A781C|nr:hypothetical protein [Pseudoflavonifractor sp. 524-17]